MFKYIFEIKIKKRYSPKEYIKAWRRGSLVIQKSPGALGTKLYRKIGEKGKLLAIASWTSKKARDAAMRKLKKLEAKKQIILHKHKNYANIKVLGAFEEISKVNPKND
ncbi:MAG: antibiotic biosynthesis monooxygenase [bacterium]|nr:antibiotic biosynthesis monooxygenase [bacterium]